MGTRIPVTIEGNLTSDPEHGTADSGTDYTRFTIAINDRELNTQTGLWEDKGTLFHRVVVYDKQSHHAAASLRKGDQVIVTGELRFGTYTDQAGTRRETRDIRADSIGASLKFTDVSIHRAPKANSPAATYAPGLEAEPVSTTGAGLTH